MIPILATRNKIIITLVTAIAVIMIWLATKFAKTEQYTNDAYIRADISQISPRIAGVISDVKVTDYQRVKKGELLAVIDQQEFKIAVKQARAAVHSASAKLADATAHLTRQHSVIAEAQAKVHSAQAELDFARQEQARYQRLAHTGAGSMQDAQRANTHIRIASAKLAQEQATLDATRDMLAVLQAQQAEAEAAKLSAQTVQSLAELNLSYTCITAPNDGVVGQKRVRVGEFVRPGTALLAIVPLEQAYIIANFQETQIRQVVAGQPVSIRLDTFSGITMKGFVDSIAPASGVSFAAIAPDNATGNFTKVTQRIPVKIVLDRQHTPRELLNALRIGMSAEVGINTSVKPSGWNLIAAHQ